MESRTRQVRGNGLVGAYGLACPRPEHNPIAQPGNGDLQKVGRGAHSSSQQGEGEEGLGIHESLGERWRPIFLACGWSRVSKVLQNQ